MSKVISRADFCAACGIVKSALSKAEHTGRVIATPEGMIRLDKGNMFFLESCRYKKIEQMILTGKVLPGWSCLCAAIKGKRRIPLIFYSPGSVDDEDSIPVEEAEGFEIDVENGKAKRIEDGVVFNLLLVTHPKVPPPWLDRGAIAEGRRARKAASSRAPLP